MGEGPKQKKGCRQRLGVGKGGQQPELAEEQEEQEQLGVLEPRAQGTEWQEVREASLALKLEGTSGTGGGGMQRCRGQS